jgi:hypothetical protein
MCAVPRMGVIIVLTWGVYQGTFPAFLFATFLKVSIEISTSKHIFCCSCYCYFCCYGCYCCHCHYCFYYNDPISNTLWDELWKTEDEIRKRDRAKQQATAYLVITTAIFPENI